MSKLFNSILQGFKEFGEITNNKSLLNQIDEIETSETFEEDTIHKSIYTIDYVDNTGASFKDHIKASSEEDALKKFNKKSKNFVNGVRKIKGHPYIDYLDDDASYDEIDDFTEDTVRKSNDKWTNRGDGGEEHGEFNTKSKADAQRKAMFAKGYKGEGYQVKLKIRESAPSSDKRLLDEIKKKIIEGKAANLPDNYVYQIFKVNSKNFDMPEQLVNQLKDEGLYDNSFIGVIYPKNESIPLDASRLPIYGERSRYVTKFFRHTPTLALEDDLRGRDLKLRRKLIDGSKEEESLEESAEKRDIFCVDCDTVTTHTYKGPFKDGSKIKGRYICTRCGCENNDEPLTEAATHCVYFTQDGIEQIEFEGSEDECNQYIADIQAEQDAEFGNEAPERFIKKLNEKMFILGESISPEYKMVEYNYDGDELSDYLRHVRVRTDSVKVALHAADEYVMNKQF